MRFARKRLQFPCTIERLMDSGAFFFVVFLVIFALNVVPAFAPATWTVISYISIRYGGSILALAMVGALAATAGRVVLAKLSHVLVRRKLLSDKTKDNIDAIKTNIEARRALTAGLFLFYAVCPLPSNNLFIAYGLTTMPLKLIAIPFFLGRVLSYAFWALTAGGVARGFGVEAGDIRSTFSYYFAGAQVITLLMVVAFARIDWRQLFSHKRLRWLR
jgi:hypothetical protein